jgi:hypothetical protein
VNRIISAVFTASALIFAVFLPREEAKDNYVLDRSLSLTQEIGIKIWARDPI